MRNVYECIFVWENKSFTNVREFVKSRTTVEELVCLQTLLRMFPPGIPVLRRTPPGNIENSVESVGSYLGKRVQESRLSVALLGIYP